MEDVGSYGRQIGRITDALEVLISTLDRHKLTKKQLAAITMLDDQAEAIRAIKSKTTGRKYTDLSKPPAAVLCECRCECAKGIERYYGANATKPKIAFLCLS